MKIAFATRDCQHVDEQFRRAAHLVVFQLTAAGAAVDRVYGFAPGRTSTDDRIRAILGSAVVFVAAIGPSVAARLVAHGIRPATVARGARIEDVVASFQAARERDRGVERLTE